MGISSIFYKENSGMIRLNINPKVLISLQAAFPKPEHSAEKALNKYSELLEDYFEQAMLGGFSMWSNAGFAYCISLHKLANKGPTIGSKKNSTKIRLHKWLVDNKLSLFSLVKKGGIFGDEKGNSYIATSPLAELEFYDPKYRSEIEFKKRHPDFENLTKNQIHTDYDRLQIDIGSLRNYIHRLVRNPNKSSSFLRVYNQALKITAVASYQLPNLNARNMFFQKKKPSQFGRIYYEGVSVQCVNRELRTAMIGNCFEYDMRSSVVAWKLGYAQGYITANNLTGTVKTVFPQCCQYWLDKKILIDKIRQDVFRNNKDYTISRQVELMKEAMTALNFGAVLIDVKDKEYAIKKILSSPYDKITYGKFRKNYYVKAFSSEQKKLDKYILQIEKANNPSLLTNPILQTSTKRIKNSSILSYLYQHAETEVMDIFRNHARINKLTILANVHDAIYLRYKLSNSLFRQITNDIHSISGNTYWFLNETQHHRVT